MTSTALVQFTGKEMALVRRTSARDANDTEFDQFIAFCRMARLNPLRRQVFLFVFNKNNPSKRQSVIVTSIDGLRAIADRSGNYRPDETAPRVTYGETKGPLNPMGIKTVQVTVYKHSHGQWHPVAGEAHWSEFAPIRTVWADDETGKRVPTDRKELDPTKEGWTRMPHLMLAKCFAPDTEVLTSAGFQRFDALRAPVMQVTERGLEPVAVRAWSQPYAGEMVVFDSDDINFSVTPNHDMITTAGKLEAGALYEAARARPLHFIPRLVPGAAIDADISDAAIRLSAAIMADGYKRGAGFAIAVSGANKIALLDEIGGYRTRTERKCAGDIAHAGVRTVVTRSDKIVYRYGIEVTEGLCMCDGDTKTIDLALLGGLSRRQAKLFVDDLIFFDGHVMKDTGVRRFYSSRRDLVGAFEVAAVIAGYAVSAPKQRTSDIGREPNFSLTISDRDAIGVSRWGRPYRYDQNSTGRFHRGLELQPNKDGIVWCVTVPSGEIVVRRNGFSMRCGNCAEAQALRKGWPEDLSGVYGEEETDRIKTIELTATEIADAADQQDRLEKVGGANVVVIDWLDGEPLQPVPAGKFFDAAMAFIQSKMKPGEEEPSSVLQWREKNRQQLRTFWAFEKDAALAINKRIEEVEKWSGEEPKEEPKAKRK